ncbi:MAG: prenyltransferase/squalene oxidase repeat-containing protein [Planctomycetota bacterium]
MAERITIQQQSLYLETYQDVLLDMFKNAHWFLVSLVIHLVIGVVLVNMDWRTYAADQDFIIQGEPDAAPDVPLQHEEPEKETTKIEELKTTETPPAVPDEPIFEEEPVMEDKPIAEYENEISNVIGVGPGVGPDHFGPCRGRDVSKGSPITQKAVNMALAWLASHQDPEGYWDCDGFSMQDNPEYASSTGKGKPLNDVGCTGLALLAFLGAGSTPKQGEYRDTVRAGVKYLCNIQNPETGCLPAEEGEQFMYNHALGTLALTEAYGLSRWMPLKNETMKALQYIHDTKNPQMAWRYNDNHFDRGGQNDVSVTGWMFMCLASAKDFDLPCCETDIREAMAYIDMMTDPVTGRTGYTQRGSYSSRERGDDMIWPAENGEAMTAVAMLCRIFYGYMYDDMKIQKEALEKGAELLLGKLPEWSRQSKGMGSPVDYYYWYYGSYAMYQMGGRYWRMWKDKMISAVVENQITDPGNEMGSWDPQVDPWGDSGGRVYSTALCTLCLEVFYRYENIVGSRLR